MTAVRRSFVLHRAIAGGLFRQAGFAGFDRNATRDFHYISVVTDEEQGQATVRVGGAAPKVVDPAFAQKVVSIASMEVSNSYGKGSLVSSLLQKPLIALFERRSASYDLEHGHLS